MTKSYGDLIPTRHDARVRIAMTSPSRVLMLVALLAACLFAAACDSGDADDTGSTDIVAYFLDREGALVGESRAVDGDPLSGALEQLATGPESADLLPALESGAAINSAEIAGSIALIDLNAAFAAQIPGGGSVAQIESFAPIVYTATSIEGVNSVSLTVDGGVPDVPGLALDLTEPLGRADLPIPLEEPR